MVRAALIAVVVVVSAHAVVMDSEFVDFDDDVVFLANADLRRPLSEAPAVVAEVFALDRANWRPLRDLSHWIDFVAHGQDPAWAHAHNLALLAALVAVCVAFFGAPAAMALAFLHPLVVEPVAWVSGRKDLLAALFFFATLLAFRRAAERWRPAWTAATAGLFALGVMSKGHVVVAPLVLLLVAWHDHLAGRSVDRRAAGVSVGVVALLAAAAVPLVARGTVMLANAPAGPLPELTVGDRLQLPARYLGHLLWPWDLNHVYLTGRLDGAHTALAVAGVGVLLGALWLGTAALRRGDPRGAWVLAAVAVMLPYAHLVATGTVYLADRYTLLALPFLFAAAAPWLTRRWLVLALGVALAALGLRQHLAWHDSVSLWSRMTRVYPTSAWGYERMGRALYARGRLEEAAGAWVAAAARAPGDPQPLNNAAVALMALGHLDQAEALLRDALRLRPRHPPTEENLRRLQAARAADAPTIQR